MSNDGADAAVERVGRGVVVLVPLTSNIRRVLRFQVLVGAEASGLERDTKAQCEQVRAVSVETVSGLTGRLPSPPMRSVDEALRMHLDL